MTSLRALAFDLAALVRAVVYTAVESLVRPVGRAQEWEGDDADPIADYRRRK